jgi:plasmid stabilization system protein ParE
MAGRTGTAIWSPEALVDLGEIWNYYERVAGRNTAEKIAREIGAGLPPSKIIRLRGGLEVNCAHRRIIPL